MLSHISNRLAPAYRAGDLLDQTPADLVGVRDRGSQHVRHQWRGRHLDGDARKPLCHHVGGGLHQLAMERRRYRQQHGALGTLVLGNLHRPVDGCLVAGHHDLSAAIVVGSLADLTLGRFARHRNRRLKVETEQCSHGARADGNGLLHRKTTGAQQPRRIGKAEAVSRRQRRIFAKRMAGDIGSIPADGKSGFGFQDAERRNRDRHQSRLRILGKLQRLCRAVPNDGRQPIAKGRVDLVEHSSCHRKRIRERLAHADGLGALPRKSKCCRHWQSPMSHNAGTSRGRHR